MKSSPIYNIISNPKRKSDCSFGSDGFRQEIRVGTSSSNSHTLANITVEMHDENGERLFVMFLDGKVVKKGILNGKDFEMTQDIFNL